MVLTNAEGVIYYRPGCKPRIGESATNDERRRRDTFHFYVPPVPGSCNGLRRFRGFTPTAMLFRPFRTPFGRDAAPIAIGVNSA